MMSKERELLKKWINECMWRGSNMILLEETKALLAQPEQEPVAWGYKKRVIYKPEGSEEEEIIPLYTAPPKREPLTPQQISVGNQSMLNVTRDAFKQGVKYAEKMHGITGGE